MTTNIGALDRGARILTGLALIAWALGFIPGYAANAWGWIGIVPLATSLIGWCPLYTVLGVSTCGGRA
jgi:hypothetical protein